MAPSFHSVSASTRSLFAPNLFDSSRPPYGHGVRRFSLSDVVSNVLLCIPFGFLWVGGEFYLRMQLVLWRRATSSAFRPGKKTVFVGPAGLSYRRGQPRWKSKKTTSSRRYGGPVGGSDSRSRPDRPAVTESFADRCLAVWWSRLGRRRGIRALSADTDSPHLICLG